MFARILILIVLASCGTLRAADDWNLFASAPPADTCQLAWDLFDASAATVPSDEPPPDDVQAWNLFATAPTAETPLFLGQYASPCVLLFTGRNCPPCDVAKSELVPLLEAHGWPVSQIAYHEQPDVFDQLDVDAVPTFIAIRRGIDCGRYSGKEKRPLCDMLRSANRVELQ